jgi:hypothetical protein
VLARPFIFLLFLPHPSPGDFVGALDYIWYTDSTLSVERVLQIPSEEVVLSHNGALPNPFMCSDHIPIVADVYGKLVPRPSTYRAGAEEGTEKRKEGGGRGRNNKR